MISQLVQMQKIEKYTCMQYCMHNQRTFLFLYNVLKANSMWINCTPSQHRFNSQRGIKHIARLASIQKLPAIWSHSTNIKKKPTWTVSWLPMCTCNIYNVKARNVLLEHLYVCKKNGFTCSDSNVNAKLSHQFWHKLQFR